MPHQKLERHLSWFRSLLLENLLPRWLQHAVGSGGLFLMPLDRQWRPVPPQSATLVTQARMLYNLASGYRLTGDGRYLEALNAGAAFLAEGFRDREHGGWYHAVGPGGNVLDPRKDAYDFAFVIFGMAHAAEVTGDGRFRATMLEAWEILDTRFRDEYGGFIRRMTPDYQPDEQRRTQNPTMHLFEALLAAGRLEPAMKAQAESVGRFVIQQLIRWDGQPCLPEWYDLDWKPLEPEDGGHADVGHQFEWAYLLSVAVEEGLPGWWLAPATDLLQFGLRAGLNPHRGSVAAEASYRAELTRDTPVWWVQCEAIRAMLRFAVRHGRDDLWRPIEACLAFCNEHFVDAQYGGWLESLAVPLTDDRPFKGSTTKVDYHVVGMCNEAIRLFVEPPGR
jgi:mannose/cellobiose epimerase-like protein (N-acyl-D-glucosamine 2-epimerase family)